MVTHRNGSLSGKEHMERAEDILAMVVDNQSADFAHVRIERANAHIRLARLKLDLHKSGVGVSQDW